MENYTKRPRGRPRKNQADRKITLAFRGTRALEARLKAEAAKSGRALSQEIEARVRLSFEASQRVQDQFGGAATYWFFFYVAFGMKEIEALTGKRWWEDRFTFGACQDLINTALGYFMPKNRFGVPKRFRGRAYERDMGHLLAATIFSPIELVAMQPGRFDLEDAEGATAFNASGPLATKMTNGPLSESRKRARPIFETIERGTKGWRGKKKLRDHLNAQNLREED